MNSSNKFTSLTKPPPYKANMIVKRHMRFISSAGVADIAAVGIAGAFGCLGTGSTTVIPIIRTLKVHRVEMWQPYSTSNNTNTCAITWYNSAGNKGSELSDVTTSSADTAHLVSSPPQGSQCSFWIDATSTVSLFELNSASNCIVDLWVSVVVADGTVALVALSVTNATTANLMYYLALDHNGADIYRPISLLTIV